MKRLIAAAVLTIVIGILYFSGFFIIDNACKNADIMLNECINAYNSEKNAEKKAENLEDYWAEKEKILSVFANHSDIDKIEMAIGILKVYSKTNEKEMFNEYHQTVKILIHQLKEDTVPAVHSIF